MSNAGRQAGRLVIGLGRLGRAEVRQIWDLS